MDLDGSEDKIVLKVAQIFYKRNSQIYIVDAKEIIEQMAIEYAMENKAKVNIYSPYSEKRYILDKKEIVAFIICDPEDIQDGDDDEDDEDATDGGKHTKGLW